MITRSYKSKLKSVLRLYRDFRRALEETGRPVSRDTESLYRKLHSPFSIAVISDLPGGSESFINACLGKAILPEDAGINAAVRIQNGRDYSYEAVTAGGESLKGSGWKNVHEFLMQRVIVPGRYRYLPAACINALLIKKQGAVTDDDIAKTENELLHGGSSEESSDLKSLIGSYIREFRSQWENIVTEITVTVPLSEEFRGITITDCPMIPAECNECNTTRKPADDAGAIIYVKPLDMKLPESECLNALPALQNSEKVFLVFTGRAALSAGEFENLRYKAIETWSKAIPEERIFFADCMAQRFIGSLEEYSAERIEGCLDELSSVRGKFKAAEDIWCSVNRNADLFREKMEELAGFNEIHRAVGKFVRNARNRQLAEFLGSMLRDCNALINATPSWLRIRRELDVLDLNKLVYEKIKAKELDGISNVIGDLVADGKYTDHDWIAGRTVISKLQAYIKEQDAAQNTRKHYYQKLKSSSFMMICCDKVHTLSYCPEEAGFPKFTEYDKAYVSESDDETLPDFSQLVPEKITRKTNASAEEFELYLTSEVYGDDYAKAQLVFENSDSMEQFRDNIVYIQYFINYCVQMYNHLILQEKKITTCH